MWLRGIVTKVLINPFIRTRTRHFRHAYHSTRDTVFFPTNRPKYWWIRYHPLAIVLVLTVVLACRGTQCCLQNWPLVAAFHALYDTACTVLLGTTILFCCIQICRCCQIRRSTSRCLTSQFQWSRRRRADYYSAGRLASPSPNFCY
jgi:hypothetical protein